MKMIIEETGVAVAIDGKSLKVWVGINEQGARCTVLTQVVAAGEERDSARFYLELERLMGDSPEPEDAYEKMEGRSLAAPE